MSLFIHHFHIAHNAPPVTPPEILRKYCFQFLLCITIVPKEGGRAEGQDVLYWQCERSELMRDEAN